MDSVQPALLRVVNRGGRAITSTGIPIVRLDEIRLIDEASRRTGLADFGDPSFRDPLRRLLESWEEDSALTLIGRIAARQDTLRLLINRLTMRRDRKRHREIEAEVIRAPLFVTGLPRTGTTLLHGLLAQDPANRTPLNWETMFPSPPPERARYERDRRIGAAERQLRWFHRLSPNFRKIHPLAARLPEECLIITSHSFLSFQFQTSHNVRSYQRWLERQDLRRAYTEHREFLQHLQWRCRGDRWVLKAPAHLFGLEALLATYPDAGLIFTHRDPLEVVPSLASLHTVLRRTFSDAVDRVAIGTEATQRWADGITRALHVRDNGPAAAERFMDVHYTDLVRDPLGTVRRVYAHFDLPLTSVIEERMRQFVVCHPKDQHGRHNYSLADFGLDAERERYRYRTYRERFGFVDKRSNSAA